MDYAEEVNYLFDLPPELVEFICSFINIARHSFLMRRVCKRWYNWINITDFSIGMVLPHEIDQIAQCFSKHPNPIGLTFAKGSVNVIRTLDMEPISRITQLTSLAVISTATDGRDPFFLAALTNLESLNVNLISANAVQQLKKLTKLMASVFEYEGEEKIQKLELPNLESVTLHFGAESNGTYPYLESASKITELQVTVNSKTFPLIKKNILDVADNLKKLTVISKGCFETIDKKYTNLESLKSSLALVNMPEEKLTFLDVAEEPSLERVKKCTNLKVLIITSLKSQSHNDQPLLSPLPYLERFEWRDWSGTATFNLINSIRPDNLTAFMATSSGLDSKIVEILAKFTKLTSLQFATSSQMSQELTAILSLTALTDLSVRGASFCTTSIQSLTKLGNLQRLAIYGYSLTVASENRLVLTALTNLEYLSASSTSRQTFDLRGLTRLKSLNITEPALVSLVYDPNDFVANLEVLSIYSSGVNGVTWKDMSTWTSLRQIYLSDNGEIDPDVIPQLTTLKFLTRLAVNHLPWHENFTMLSRLYFLMPKSTLPHDVVRLKMPFYDRM